MTAIKPLSGLDFNILHQAFAEAFSDYGLPPMDSASLARMLKRRGFNPDLSFGAFENSKLVSFTFNGIGVFNGVQTAYDTGTGTIKKFRGKGLARRVFLESMPYLVDAGIKQYLLEVLQNNTKALPLYRDLGFQATREFNFFTSETDKLILDRKVNRSEYIFREITEQELSGTDDFRDFCPSWQNNFEAVRRNLPDFRIIGTFSGKRLAGYGITEPATGDITQIAVDKPFRRKGIGTALMGELLKFNTVGAVKAINTETGCESINSFFEKIGLPLKGKQFEMVLEF